MSWHGLRETIRGERLPAAFVDLDALLANVDRTVARMRGSGKSLRVASKSVRHVGLLRRILQRGGAEFQGLMCYSVDEALFLAEEGFDDLLVAYPTVQQAPLRALADRARSGLRVSVIADCLEHVAAASTAAAAASGSLDIVVELDTSFRPVGGRVHIGARRSPLRDAAAVVALAQAIAQTESVRFAGIMGYEAHIAGVQDDNPFARAMNPVKRAMKRAAVPAVARLRADVVDALRRAGLEPKLVNGGGTGSVHLTAREACVTEVTAGSGFLCPHLFDYFADFSLEPAAFFALEVARISDPGYVTCASGGFVASGEPGMDRLPAPWLPAGLEYLGMEGAGEVQTPLRVPHGAPDLRVGDPVFFRHAKAGELAERFNDYVLLANGSIVGREPTYRGQGRCFG